MQSRGRLLWALPVKIILARVRLYVAILLSIPVWFFLPLHWPIVTRLLVCWNASTLLYFLMILEMMHKSNHLHLRKQAEDEDEGKVIILCSTIMASILSLAAIVSQVSIAKGAEGIERFFHLSLVVISIVSAWAFIHMIFALHYAHVYWQQKGGEGMPSLSGEEIQEREIEGGLRFPGTKFPHYIDFIYFSYVIGVALQTADVETISAEMRKIALLHGIASFFFNTIILALAINIAAGILG